MKLTLLNNKLTLIIILALLFQIAHSEENSADVPKECEFDYFFLKSLDPMDGAKLQGCTPPAYKKGDPLEGISKEDLFRQIFKTEPPPRIRNFMVRFFADNQFLGDLEVNYDSAFTSFAFTSKKFLTYLDTLLTAEAHSKVINENGIFNSRELLDQGFGVDLNEMNFELRITVPPESKALQRTNLVNRSEPKGSLIEPAIFSFYLNMRGTDNIYCRQYSYEKDYGRNKYNDECERMPAYLDLDGATAMLGFVFEGSGNIREPREEEEFSKNHVRRNDFRLLRDFNSYNSRVSLGDVGSNTAGIMGYETMGGIRYEYGKHLFNVSNYEIYDQLYKMQFFLETASQVEIRVNGRTVRRFYLPAGFHEINGFGGWEGTNFIQVLLVKPDGSVEVIPYEYQIGNSRNLAKGEARYSLTAGFRRAPTIMGYSYDYNEQGISTDFLYGVLPYLSIGVNGQASEYNQMAGLQALFSINQRNWLELLGLVNYEDSLGKRSELRYTYSTNPVSYSLTGYYQSRYYNPDLFGIVTGIVSNRAGISASASTRLFNGSVSANAGMFLNRESEFASKVTKRYGVALSQNIFRISFNANASVSQDKNNWAPYASLGVGYLFGIDRHNITFTNTTTMHSKSTDPDDYEWVNRSNLNWNWTNGGSGNGAKAYSAGIGMQDWADNMNFRLGARHNYNRAALAANYNLYNYEYDYYSRMTHTIKADLGTSFMFADGLWAFGRPVSRGFILAGTSKNLDGSTVQINYSEYHDASFSENGWLGAAYYNQISNYRANEIRISLIDAPMGAWLEQNRYYTMGAYKQGYALRLGSDASALLCVNLLKEGAPLSYTYVIVDNKTTFTNNEGTLLVGNLKPGKKYRLSFGENSPIKDIEIDIPENAGNFIELPDIVVEYK